MLRKAKIKNALFLQALSSEQSLPDFDLNHKKLIVGRAPHADIVIDHPSVSYYHCLIVCEDDCLHVTDLKSHHGVLVNGHFRQEATLFSGDSLIIGELDFTVGEKELANKEMANRDEHLESQPVKKAEPMAIPQNLEGLTLIDGEYCDITFNESNFTPAETLPLEVSPEVMENYIDIDDVSDHGKSPSKEKSIIQTLTGESVRVTTLVNGIVTAINYYPLKKSVIKLSNQHHIRGTLYVPGHQGEKDSFLSISKEGAQVTVPEGYHCAYAAQPTFNIPEDQSVFLTKGTVQLVLEIDETPPALKLTHFFQFEKEFLQESAKVFSLFLLFMIGVLLIDTTLPEPPKKLAVIYKPARKLKKIAKKTATNNPDQKDTNTGIKKKESPIKELEMAQKKAPRKKKKTVQKKVKKLAQSQPKKSAQKPKKTPVKAYKFNKSKLQNFMASSQKFKSNAVAAKSQSNLANPAFAAVSAEKSSDNNALSANAPTKLGSDQTGAGKRSSGTKGLSSKRGFNTLEAGPRTVVLGSIDPELLRKILQEYIPQFRYCYQQELKINEAAEGVIDLSFRIAGGGKVSNIKVTGRKAKFSSQGVACMGKVLRIIKFPTPKGGGVVDVKQPLNFVSERGSY